MPSVQERESARGIGAWVGRSTEAMRTTLSVLEDANFRLYWGTTFAYYAGIWVDQLARLWLAYYLTGSAVLLGLVVLTQGVPHALLAVVGGALADRVPKRTLLLWAQLLLAGTAIALWALLITGLLEYWHLIALSLFSGAAVGLSLPGRLSFVSEVVSEERFVRAYSLYYVALNVMRIGGPAIGGATIAGLGPEGAYFLIAFAHLVALVGLLFVKPRADIPTRPQTPFLRDLAETFTYARRTPTLLILMGAELGFIFFAFPSIQLMPIFAEDVFSVGPEGLGTLMAGVGVGGLVGSLVAAGASGARRKSLLLLVAGVFQGMTLIVFASASWYALAVALLMGVGFASAAYSTFNSTLFQLSAPQAMRGRVMSLYMLGSALQPLGVVPISALADAMGVRLAVMVAGGLLMLHMLGTGLLFPAFRRLRS